MLPITENRQGYRASNAQAVPIHAIPVFDYDEFGSWLVGLLLSDTANHCVTYHALMLENQLHFFAAVANDAQATLEIALCKVRTKRLAALSPYTSALFMYEREIAENTGIIFEGHSWLKPVRYAYNRANLNNTMDNYPFFKISSEETHEVGVGPIHAGVIEPGHFRFSCLGEQVAHLEIQLGYQHRGVESLMLTKKNWAARNVLVESIAGDTVCGHTAAYMAAIESLAGIEINTPLQVERTLALELERVAVHVGNLSAVCMDLAYQLGSAALGALRTPIINYFQFWCGNRFAKSLFQIGGTFFPLTQSLIDRLLQTLDSFEQTFHAAEELMFSLPGIQNRLQKTGQLLPEQVQAIGGVGLVARMVGMNRDIRYTHPLWAYANLQHLPVIPHQGDPFGDVSALARLRTEEIYQSIAYMSALTHLLEPYTNNRKPDAFRAPTLMPNHIAVSLVEGWRGEICNTILTDANGALAHYKVKDPSFHNWFALALAVRNNEISDFPICNKSFDLSYCGHDL